LVSTLATDEGIAEQVVLAGDVQSTTTTASVDVKFRPCASSYGILV
jgi:hypothetical protein